MQQQMKALFSPCITLYWRGKGGKLTAAWHHDLVKDGEILRQFKNEAGVRTMGLSPKDYDAVLSVAGKYGYSLETIGGPEDE